jgi:signal transduction histidine kinase
MGAAPHHAAAAASHKRLTLVDLVDPDSFRDVFHSYAELYRVGIKLFAADGTKLVDARVGSGEFCGYLFQYGPTQQRCTALVRKLKTHDFWADAGASRNLPTVVNCFSGLRYMVLPVIHEGELLGRIIFGPYVPEQAPRPSPLLAQLEPRLDAARLADLMAPVRRAPDDAVQKVLEQMHRVLSVLVFSSHRAALVSQMHIESVKESYRDLVERTRQIQEANEQLKELDTLKSHFLATVSHELRTPLTSIIGYSEMLLEDMPTAPDSQHRQYLETIMEKGESLMKLITSILDFSRIAAGNLKLHLGDVDVVELTKTAQSSVVPQAQKKRLSLQVDLAPGLPVITGDSQKLHQVLVNLLGNAVKFTPEDGHVILGVRHWFGARRHPQSRPDGGSGAQLFAIRQEDFVRMEVTDTGPGIPPDQLEKVFERFYQVDSSSTRTHGGTGLGLSIVKSLVEAHHGDVWCESQLGRGCRFVVLIPVQRA